MKKLISQIILLTKNVYLLKPAMHEGYSSKFLVGKKSSFDFTGGFGIEWWHTKISFRAVENIASMLISSDTKFIDCDLDTANEVIKNTLTEICIDRRLFNSNDVCFARKQTLYDCRCNDSVIEFGRIILEEISQNLQSRLSNWCTVYVAPRLSGETFIIDQENISVISKSDDVAWKNLLSKGYVTNSWSLLTGGYNDGGNTAFSHLQYDYVFVVEERGTQKGSKFASGLKLRRLFAVIFSVVSERLPYSLSKAGAEPYALCLQFPGASHANLGIYSSHIGEMIPYYINDIILSSQDIQRILDWFDTTSKLEKDPRSRIEKCSHFINRAMNSSDIESFINYFIALDALFGKRGAVEASILKGVNDIDIAKKWLDKAAWLFDLRNELVHGGSRHIKEWPDYQKYYKHFHSKPEVDMEKLAFFSLINAPKTFAKYGST